MFRRFLSLIEVQYLLVVLQRLRLRSIFVSVPRARPECGQIAMLIRDGRRRNGSAARGRRTDGRTRTGSRDRRRRRSAQWPHSVARFMGEIANRDGNLAIEKGGISVGRRQQSCCRSRTILCNVEKQGLYFSLFLCMCPYAIKRVDVHVQWWAEALFPGLVNFVPAVAYQFCLNMPATFSQPGNGNLAHPCSQ